MRARQINCFSGCAVRIRVAPASFVVHVAEILFSALDEMASMGQCASRAWCCVETRCRCWSGFFSARYFCVSGETRHGDYFTHVAARFHRQGELYENVKKSIITMTMKINKIKKNVSNERDGGRSLFTSMLLFLESPGQSTGCDHIGILITGYTPTTNAFQTT